MLIEIEKVDSLRILTMKNESENRISPDFMDDFNKALDEFEREKEARAAVITGSVEKFFSTGLDIPKLTSLGAEGMLKALIKYITFLRRVLIFPKPLVAAINGHAIAGGFFLSLAMDWRVMREDRGFLAIPEIDLGVGLPPGHIALVEYAISTRWTDYLSLTGERIPGPKALRIGAVDEIAGRDEVVPKAIAKARQLGMKDPNQYAVYKKNLRKIPAKIIEEGDPVFMRALIKQLFPSERKET